MKHDDKIQLTIELTSFLLSAECAAPIKLDTYGNRKKAEVELNALIKSVYATITEIENSED